MTRTTEPPEEIAGERGLPSVNNHRVGAGIGSKVGMVVMGVVAVVGVIAVNGWFNHSQDERKAVKVENSNDNQVRNTLPKLLNSAHITNISDQMQDSPITPPHFSRGNHQQDLTPEERKLHGGLLVFSDHARSTTQPSTYHAASVDPASSAEQQAAQIAAQLQAGVSAKQQDNLENHLKPTPIQGVSASLIRNRSFMLTRGAFLDCVLETAISSDVPGMTSCRLTRNVYSSDGKVLLIERGSRVIGQYQSGLQQGKARIFVLWSRLETPNGVIVALDSPGTDTLGRSGHEGTIDTHFWQRFGSAILLSFIDDLGTALANQGKDHNGDVIALGGITNSAQNAANIALENSVNISPTLVKNQGEAIHIFVARDIDFRSVYDLQLIR